MSKTTGEIRDADDLHRVLRDHWGGNFVFRGEASNNYPLRPKWGRAQVADSKNTQATEQALFNDFRRRAAPFILQLPANEWDWLALAQHHGISTRLLDWTENPLVATYFATQPLVPDDRVLYMIDQYALGHADEAQSPFALDATVIYRPSHVSARISSQGGLFTAHGKPDQVFEHANLERWVIKEECSVDINVTLQTYGVNEVSIFRDLDSLARTLNSNYIHGTP